MRAEALAAALALGACQAPTARSPAPADPWDTAPPNAETGAPEPSPADTAAPPASSVPDADAEELAAPDPVDRDELLCQLELTCDGTLTEADKIPCTLRVEGGDGRVDYEGAAVAWVRGRSSSKVAKPGYGVELRDEDDQDLAVNLLGMGGESDWVLNGLYYDRLLVRNKLGFDLFQSWGGPERYAPQSALCELVLNDAYVGAYALTERIKRDDDRIDITADDGEGGTFVMKQNDEGCFYYNSTTYGCWKLLSPDDDAISDDAAAWLTRYLGAWETAVSTADPSDMDAGPFAFVDMDSFVDIVLLEELFKNEDCWYTSMHIWRDRGGKIHFTPWDLDMTFGQFPYYPYGDYGNAEIWIDYRPLLVSVMLGTPEFQARVAERWAALREGSLSEEALNDRLDELQAILGDAIDRNDEVWPIESINYGGWFYEVSSYADEDAHVRDWMSQRLAWMDAQILGE